jgi:hypothetical protein
MFWRIWRIINEAVKGGESWYAAWQAIKAELKPYLPGLSSAVPVIAGLMEGLSYTVVAVLALAVYILVWQRWGQTRHTGAIVTRPDSALDQANRADSTIGHLNEQIANLAVNIGDLRNDLSKNTEYCAPLFKKDRVAKHRSVLESAQRELAAMLKFLDDPKQARTNDYVTDLAPARDKLSSLLASNVCNIIDCESIQQRVNQQRDFIRQQSKLVDYSAQGFPSDSYFVAFHTQRTRIEMFLEAVNTSNRRLSKESRECTIALGRALFRKD